MDLLQQRLNPVRQASALAGKIGVEIDQHTQIRQRLLLGRFAAERLSALAQSTGASTKTVPEVLFICVHNAGRSQMAAALLTHHAAGAVHVRSAGSLPAAVINPIVEQAMTKVGLDLAAEFPKPLTDDVVTAADVVISMGCDDACPVYPGKRYLDWQVADPDNRAVPRTAGPEVTNSDEVVTSGFVVSQAR